MDIGGSVIHCFMRGRRHDISLPPLSPPPPFALQCWEADADEKEKYWVSVEKIATWPEDVQKLFYNNAYQVEAGIYSGACARSATNRVPAPPEITCSEAWHPRPRRSPLCPLRPTPVHLPPPPPPPSQACPRAW